MGAPRAVTPLAMMIHALFILITLELCMPLLSELPMKMWLTLQH